VGVWEAEQEGGARRHPTVPFFPEEMNIPARVLFNVRMEQETVASTAFIAIAHASSHRLPNRHFWEDAGMKRSPKFVCLLIYFGKAWHLAP
jgi:hypothetical protein